MVVVASSFLLVVAVSEVTFVAVVIDEVFDFADDELLSFFAKPTSL